MGGDDCLLCRDSFSSSYSIKGLSGRFCVHISNCKMLRLRRIRVSYNQLHSSNPYHSTCLKLFVTLKERLKVASTYNFRSQMLAPPCCCSSCRRWSWSWKVGAAIWTAEAGESSQPLVLGILGQLRKTKLSKHAMAVPGRAATWVRGCIDCFLRVSQLFCSFPPAQASRENSHKLLTKTSYPSSGPS